MGRGLNLQLTTRCVVGFAKSLFGPFARWWLLRGILPWVTRGTCKPCSCRGAPGVLGVAHT